MHFYYKPHSPNLAYIHKSAFFLNLRTLSNIHTLLDALGQQHLAKGYFNVQSTRARDQTSNLAASKRPALPSEQ